MKFSRQIKYYYLKVMALKGEPADLALGMAFGVFTGMMPIMPFQTALAVALALFFRGSKITAAIGTWVSNPLNWYFLYYWSYSLGSFLLGLKEQKAVFKTIIASIESGEPTTVIMGKILGAGTAFVSSFLLGGFIMGLVCAPLAYFIFLPFFRSIKLWRQARKERRHWQSREK